MPTLNIHFDKLIKNLKPPANRIEAAQELPSLVREYLEECTDFPTVEPHTRLVGSYAQKMSVTDVKDVDILVRVDGDPDENAPEARQLIRDLRAVLDDLSQSERALGTWQVAAVDANLEVERARRSIHIYFKDQDFHLDIVPCIAPAGFEQPLYVPDWGFNRWIKSHPVGFVSLLDELNGEHKGKVKKLGKLLKHYRNQQMVRRRPKSYWLGALVVKHVRSGKLDMDQPVPNLFRDLLAAIHSDFSRILEGSGTPHIKDPMLGHDVSWNWGRPDFETFMRRVEEGRDRMARALDAAEKGNMEKAVEICQALFGEEYFPINIDDEVKQRQALGIPGLARIAATGIVLPQDTLAKTITTRPTKFYG